MLSIYLSLSLAPQLTLQSLCLSPYLSALFLNYILYSDERSSAFAVIKVASEGKEKEQLVFEGVPSAITCWTLIGDFLFVCHNDFSIQVPPTPLRKGSPLELKGSIGIRMQERQGHNLHAEGALYRDTDRGSLSRVLPSRFRYS